MASQLFRERGLDGVSLEDVMHAVGMTKGGFYKHFASKEALMAVACRDAFVEMKPVRATWAPPDTGQRTVLLFIEKYLSKLHRDHPRSGCPAAALPFDVARLPDGSPVREQFCTGVEALIEELMPMMPSPTSAKRDASALLSMLVGTLALSRATSGTEMSEQLLDAAKNFLGELRFDVET